MSKPPVDGLGDVLRLLAIFAIVAFANWVLLTPATLSLESWAELLQTLGDLAEGV